MFGFTNERLGQLADIMTDAAKSAETEHGVQMGQIVARTVQAAQDAKLTPEETAFVLVGQGVILGRMSSRQSNPLVDLLARMM